MINTRLIYELEIRNCIPPLQSGFRRGRSTIDNLVLLETEIRNAFVRRNHLVSVFFDIEKAYDRAWRYGILRSLLNHFIQAEGVPQGSVLSVTLFILHLSQILDQLPPSVKGTLYVDDLQISCQGSSMYLIERQLQHAVNKLMTWCNENGHTLSAEKSRCVHFCRKTGIHPDPIIRIGNVDIPVVTDMRFLGVIFDKKLTFLPHILKLRKKCESLLNILKVLSTTTWGADRTCLLRIYQAIILARLDYGCAVYGSARPTVLRKLDTVHHSALRICCGAFRTSPVQSLYVICHQLPLHLRRKMLSAQYYLRIQSLSNHPLRQMTIPIGLRRLYNARPFNILPFCERIQTIIADAGLGNIQIKQAEFYVIPPWDVPVFSYLNPFYTFDKSSTAPVIFQKLFASHRNQFSLYEPIFTDGSKSESYVGCGIKFLQKIYSYRLHNFCSILTAELVAIFCALQKIAVSDGRKYILYTDSMSALEILSHPGKLMHPVAVDILCCLQTLQARDFLVLFCWVPGHVGILGNEDADCAAKAASTLWQTSISYRDSKLRIIHYTHSLWQESWDMETHNKLHFIKPHIHLWPIVSIRSADVKLTRLRIGHTRFTHKYLLFGERAPRCLSCNVDFTVVHILAECPNFNSHRIKYFNSTSLNIRELVGEPPHLDTVTVGYYVGSSDAI
ncbi:uncharacterized protein LOC129956547 [Argiope bruennichi]|uniref:uncharacterized protein LOC129956547 n=1 Tax=Argiope bruennichi TaxID=94029 RepID=UPI0024947D0B|nr:uncharacterized protein LOC129956547 [Argiope bruennichi]